MSDHSDLVGGSSAARRMACPGSYQMEAKLPPSSSRESSSYADEGTALHECMQYILTNDVMDLEEVLGMTFGVSETSPDGYVMTRELIEEAIEPCVDFFDALDEELKDEGGLRFLVEQRCELPGIPNAFGTSDLVGRSDKRSVIVDWKFGVGVPVKAYYNDPVTGEIKPNPQLMFYARAAAHTKPEMFEKNPDWPVDLYIVQPRGRGNEDERSTFRTVEMRDLEAFRVDLIRAVVEAKSENPKLSRGDHCRFAKCKVICPHFTQPGFALVEMNAKLTAKKAEPLEAIDVDWATVYAELLDYCALAELAIGEVYAGAHAFIEAGEKIPGWKIVDKRGTERYVDEGGAVRHVVGLGVDPEKTYEIVVKSPAQLRGELAPHMEGSTKKAKEEAAKAEIAKFTTFKSSGTKLARSDDARAEAISASQVVASLSSKLAALTGR